MNDKLKILRGITWENPRGYNPLIAATRLWEKEHPELKVEWEQKPWYQFEDAILQSLERGDGRYDLVMFDHPWVGKLADDKLLIPWDILAGKDFIDDLYCRVVSPSTESYEWNGNLWALPLDASCHAGLFRADLIDVKSIPDSWEMLECWAAEHHRQGAFYPIVLNVEGVLGSCLFLSMMASIHAPAFHGWGDSLLNTDAARKVLETICALLAYAPPDSATWGPWDVYLAMSQRDDIGYCPSIFAYVNYFGNQSRQRSLKLCRVPRFSDFDQGRAILGGVGLGVAHTCTDQDFASNYGRFLVSEVIQQKTFPLHSGQPATKIVFTDPVENTKTNGFYSVLSKNMKSAYMRPRYSGFHKVELRIGRILQRLWNHESTIDQTIDDLIRLSTSISKSFPFKNKILEVK